MYYDTFTTILFFIYLVAGALLTTSVIRYRTYFSKWQVLGFLSFGLFTLVVSGFGLYGSLVTH